MIPSDLKYSSEHEWVRMDNGEAVVGITEFAQDQLGDVVFVELPKVGTFLAQFKNFGVVESVKTASDLYSPIGGEVVAVNEDLTSQPELVNASPYDKGWMIKLKPANPAELDTLLSAEQYEALISQEGH